MREKILNEKITTSLTNDIGLAFPGNEKLCNMVQVDGEGINNICGNYNDKSKGTLVLNCFYTNIRSLTNNQKRDEMLALISEHKLILLD